MFPGIFMAITSQFDQLTCFAVKGSFLYALIAPKSLVTNTLNVCIHFRIYVVIINARRDKLLSTLSKHSINNLIIRR